MHKFIMIVLNYSKAVAKRQTVQHNNASCNSQELFVHGDLGASRTNSFSALTDKIPLLEIFFSDF